MIRTMVLVLALVGAAPRAESPSPPPPPPAGGAEATEAPAEEAPHSKVLKPLRFDVKATVDTDILLVFVELGASADVGLVPIGPGTLAAGASFDVGFCGSFCLAFNALTGLRYGQRFYTPMARLRYDIPLPVTRASPTERINAYGFLMGGLVVTTMGLSNAAGTVKVEGTDTSFAIGLGGGGQYFFTSNVFGGVEATLRYARGTYNWRVVVGSYSLSSNEDTWSLSGFSLRLNLGVRLP